MMLEPPSLPIPGRVIDGEPGAPSWWTEDGDGFEAALRIAKGRTVPRRPQPESPETALGAP